MKKWILLFSAFGLMGLAGCTQDTEEVELAPEQQSELGEGTGVPGPEDDLAVDPEAREPASESDALTRERCSAVTEDSMSEEERALYQRCQEAGLL